MLSPYIFVNGPQPCYRNDGNQLETTLGYHAFFVTWVPFIPSFLSEDFTRMITGEISRIKLIASRQIRFLNDLSSCRSDVAETFDLRFVSVPQLGQPYNKVHIFFIGKVFCEDRDRAQDEAVALWRKFCSYFPLEDPFNYPLQTITRVSLGDGRVAPSNPDLLQLALQPIRFSELTSRNLVEIRKYEDRDPMLGGLGDSQEQFIGYYPHPFRPTIDFSAMARFLETFAVQPQACVASICLRPTVLALEEQQYIHRMMQHYHHLLLATQEGENWLALYRQERFDDLRRTFDPLINQRNHLFMFKIQILGEQEAPTDVVTALGSEVMNNTTPEPRLWQETRPAQEEVDTAYRNFMLMEYAPWGRADITSPLWRLSSLVCSYEAIGAFRLPVPPESGHMPGLHVRDEPFVLPATLDTPRQSQLKTDTFVSLGNIIHRGVQTETEFLLPLSHLKRHGLVTGSTGSGKTNTCLHILTELWKSTPAVPFLVIYPIDKPDYRLLQADPDVADKLLIFTLGDDTTSPFRFNPFYVPPGILVRTYMSLLMRAFTAAFTLWDPLPAIYRAALRAVYLDAGFTDLRTAKGGDAGTHAPLLSRFYEILVETSEQMTREYGSEVKGNVRQGAEIRMRDLLQSAGHVLNVEEGAPWDQILEHPTVMEIGRVGSTEDTALVMGFLLMSLTSHLSSRRKRESRPRQHITLIEEAHRLMSSKGSGGGVEGQADPRTKASEDFANILAEVRGFSEGILIAEQIPTDLVSGAIGNTYLKIMHWLEEQRSFELFCDIMSLNKQQREYARTLPTGQAIVRSVNGRPVLVQVKNYLDRFQHPDDTPKIDDSDEAVRAFMEKQVVCHNLKIPAPVPFTMLEHATPRASIRAFSLVVRMPMKTCAFCKPLREANQCRYRVAVRSGLMVNQVLRGVYLADLRKTLAEEDVSRQWQIVKRIGAHIESRLPNASPEARRGTVYCYLAHEVDHLLREGDLEPAARSRAHLLLEHFDRHYA